MVLSALLSAARRGDGPVPGPDRPLREGSAVQDLIAVYRVLARRSDHTLHLGLTEAGMGSKGIVASSAALGVLLQEGIGDTIRYSLTPEPGGDRTLEVKAAQELLQTMGFHTFVPLVAACPGCGRTDVDRLPGARPGRPELDLGLHDRLEATLSGRRDAQRRGDGLHRQRTEASRSMPTSASRCPARAQPAAPVFIDGRKAVTLRGPTIAQDFRKLVLDYIEKRFGQPGRDAAE